MSKTAMTAGVLVNNHTSKVSGFPAIVNSWLITEVAKMLGNAQQGMVFADAFVSGYMDGYNTGLRYEDQGGVQVPRP